MNSYNKTNFSKQKYFRMFVKTVNLVKIDKKSLKCLKIEIDEFISSHESLYCILREDQ